MKNIPQAYPNAHVLAGRPADQAVAVRSAIPSASIIDGSLTSHVAPSALPQLITIALTTRSNIPRVSDSNGRGNMSKANAIFRLQAVLAICALGAISGCQKKEEAGLGSSSSSGSPAMAVAGAMAPAAESAEQPDTLAHEHTISIETSRELLSTRLREVEAACIADRASSCTILDVSHQSQQDLPTASIRMRLAPAAVETIVVLASKDGKVISRGTHAEDLGEPVADTERQLALMTLHRDRLTELMKNKQLNVDQLITVSRELATVQSQIDSLSTQRANLRRRIDTDLLTISMSLPMQEYATNRSPVTDALRSFGSDFRDAVGMVIQFLAVLLPWLVIILPGLFLVRLFWRWMGRLMTRREQHG